MGIPLYFRKIIQDYPEIVIKVLDLKELNATKISLYLDFNCLIHPCSQKVIKDLAGKQEISKERIEKKIRNEIVSYLKIVCAKFYDESQKKNMLSKLVISIDGVAPQAKMVQQRSRRFRSVLQKDKLTEVDKMFSKTDINRYLWDSNAITPGTQFMYELSQHLKKTLDTDTELKVIPERTLLDASYPGEGEHKILQHLRNKKEDEEEVSILYGLDADLIMLTMASEYKKIYLLREAVHFGKVNLDNREFLFLDIPQFKKYLCNTIKMCIDEEYLGNIEDSLLIKDYIFLCFMVGNDFLPRMPSLNIRNNAIDTLLDIYRDILCSRQEYLVYGTEINIGFLKAFFEKLKGEEEARLRYMHSSYYKKRYYEKPGLTDYQLALDALEKEPLLNMEQDKIRPNEENWKARFYYRLFHLKDTDKNKTPVQDICKLYLSGLAWTSAYYFDKCVSWRWAYYYNHVPCLDELIETLDTMDSLNPADIFSEETKPVKPFQQLLCVLPPQSSILLPPKSYQNLMIKWESPIIQYYPSKVTLENYLGYYAHYCEPHLPHLYVNDILIATEDVELTEMEKKYNKLIL